jgi:hypothetical protein
VLCLLGFPGQTLRAADPGPEVWLVTYGPGEIYWQRFGHNAIWVRDQDLGLNHTFNFGFFDFAQQDFFRRFLQGRMLYFSAAQPAANEFAQYIDENRSIRAQRLALTAEQALGLTGFLVNEVQPENRDYLYDYYLDNCSTRVRDALDLALGGRLKEAYAGAPAGQNFRDHTRRLAQPALWLYLGLELGLGSPIDRPISRWEEFFIPGELAEGMSRLTAAPGEAAAPMVVEDVQIHVSSAGPAPERPQRTWPRYFLFALAVIALAVLLARGVRALNAVVLARSWLGLSGTVGMALLFFWFATDHAAAAANLNLLLFNPLWLPAVIHRGGYRPVAVALAALGAAALVAPAVPPQQYTADVLAAFLPLNLAAAWALFRAGRSPGTGAGSRRVN